MDHISNIRFSQEQIDIMNLSISHSIKIISGPGTGKTFTLIGIIYKLLSQNICKPNEILLTTFNVESRRSLKQHIKTHIGDLTFLDDIYGSDIFLYNIDQIPFQKQWASLVRNYEEANYKSTKQMYLYLTRLLDDPSFTKTHFDLKYIMFDEFQDISEEQYLLLIKLYKRIPNVKMIIAGDEAQNIYEFRYTNFSYFKEKIHQHIPDMIQRELTINYRCSPAILNILNSLIAGAQNLQLYQMYADKNQKSQNLPLIKYYQKDEQILETLVYKLQANQSQNVAVLSFTKLNQSNLIFQIDQYNQKQRDQKDKIKYYAPVTRNKNIKNDNKNMKKNKVFIGSVHQSKGLEFSAIILLGCEDQSFPFNYRTVQRKEEARRLLYVAISRCSSDLTILIHQGAQLNYFLSQINQDLYNKTQDIRRQNLLIFNKNSNQIDYNVTQIADLLNGLQAHKIQTIYFNFNFRKEIKVESLGKEDTLIIDQKLQFTDWERIYGTIFDRFIFREIGRRRKILAGLKDDQARKALAIELDNLKKDETVWYRKQFLERLKESLNKFENKEINSMDILPDIIIVGLAGCLTQQNFYLIRKKKIQNLMNKKNDYQEFYNLAYKVYKNIDKILERYEGQDLEIKPQFTQRFYRGEKYSDIDYQYVIDIKGELDMVIDNKEIFDIKLNSEFDFDSSIQLMLYKSLKEYKNYLEDKQKIEKLTIYNVVENQIYSIDVKKWYNQKETLDVIVKYLISNEENKMEKYQQCIHHNVIIIYEIGTQQLSEIDQFLNKQHFIINTYCSNLKEMCQQIFYKLITESISQENILSLINLYRFNILYALDYLLASKNKINNQFISNRIVELSHQVIPILKSLDSDSFKSIMNNNHHDEDPLKYIKKLMFNQDRTQLNNQSTIKIEIEEEI